MPHCTPEQLALAALREPLPADDAAHLASCATCRAEVASLQLPVDVLAVPELAAPAAAIPPPPRVWDAIAAATGAAVAPDPAAHARDDVPCADDDARASTGGAHRASAASPVTVGPTPAEPAEPAAANGGTVRRLPVRQRTALLVAAAAVAGAAIGAGAVAVLGDDATGTAPVASATLDPLEQAGPNGTSASGIAEVVERPDGSRALRVELDAPSLADGYYEVWLLQPDVSGLVPVGVAQTGTTLFELPAGIDLGEYPVVDVSVEPLDGDPGHSSVSVVRGELDS